jgi:MoxR-like ATPase
MDEFDLIGPLEALATPSEPTAGAEEAAQRRADHARFAKQAIARRAERNSRFVRSYKDVAPSYVTSERFAAAVNVALSVGRPLLLTGEPGSGKTLTAYWLAHVLDLGDVLEFNVKSESRAQELLYAFDAVSWFRESQASAIVGKPNVDKRKHLYPGVLGRAFGWKQAPEQPSVVLIDEIDKAPRDFPNDLLLELDQMRFRIPEDDDRLVECPVDKRPIVVITSNQERRLPDPFLRRCVLHEIRLDAATIGKILIQRLRDLHQSDSTEPELIKAAVGLWKAVVDNRSRLVRSYTIDEFWRWLALETCYGNDPKELATALRERKLEKEHLANIETLFSQADLAILRATEQ